VNIFNSFYYSLALPEHLIIPKSIGFLDWQHHLSSTVSTFGLMLEMTTNQLPMEMKAMQAEQQLNRNNDVHGIYCRKDSFD